MSTYAIITSGGLNAAAQASEDGHFIKLKYFIPIYDYRIDENLVPDPTGVEEWDVNEISSVEGYSATYPTGERLWREGAGTYSLTDGDEFWVVSAAGAGGTGTITMPNPKHNVSMPVNLRDGVSMWNWVSADTADPPGQSSSAWILYNAVTIANDNSTNNPQTTTDRTKYFNDITYGAFLGSDGRSRGSWQARIKEDVGQFKFNKIALYAVRVDSNGIEISGDSQEPTLFAMVIFPTQIKTNFKQGGVDDVVVDFQLDVSPTAIDFNNLLYGTSGDYWMPVEVNDPINELSGYGLYNSGDVFISHMYRPEDFCAGKTVISTQHTINAGSLSAREREMPQLAIQYINNSGSSTVRKRVTMMCTISGDLFIDASTYGSGLVKIQTNGDNPSIDLDDSRILLGGVDGIFMENHRTDTSGLGVRIEEPNADTDRDAAGHFTGGDLIRENQPLIITTKNTGTTADESTDMWIVAGLITSGTNAFSAIQTSGDTHEAIWEDLFGLSDKTNPTLNNGVRGSTITILGLGGVNVQGNKIRLITQGTSTNSVEVKGNIVPIEDTPYALGFASTPWNRIYVEGLYGRAGDDEDTYQPIQLNSSLWPSYFQNEDAITVSNIDIGDKDFQFANVWSRKYNGFALGEWVKCTYTNGDISFNSSNIGEGNVNGSVSQLLSQSTQLDIANVTVAHVGANTMLVKLQLKDLVLITPPNNQSCFLSVRFPSEFISTQTVSKFFGSNSVNVSLEFLNFYNIASPKDLSINETLDLVVSNQLSASVTAALESDHVIVAKPYGSGNSEPYRWTDLDNDGSRHRNPYVPPADENNVVPVKVHVTWWNGDAVDLADLERWTISNIISKVFTLDINYEVYGDALTQLKRVIEIGAKSPGSRSPLEQAILVEFNTFWPNNATDKTSPDFWYATDGWTFAFKSVIGDFNDTSNWGSESSLFGSWLDIGFKHRVNQVLTDEQYWEINQIGTVKGNVLYNYTNQTQMREQLPNTLIYDPTIDKVFIIPDSTAIVRPAYTGTLSDEDSVPTNFEGFHKAERDVTDAAAISHAAPVAWYNVSDNQRKSTIFGREQWVCRTNQNNNRAFDIVRWFDDTQPQIRTGERDWGTTSTTTRSVNTRSGWSWLYGTL